MVDNTKTFSKSLVVQLTLPGVSNGDIQGSNPPSLTIEL